MAGSVIGSKSNKGLILIVVRIVQIAILVGGPILFMYLDGSLLRLMASK